MTVHGTVAEFLAIEEFALTDETEARAYSDVLKEYLKHHHPNFMMDEKRMSVLNLWIFASGFYGTRLLAYRNRRKAERAAKPATPAKRLEAVPRPPEAAPAKVNGKAGLSPSDLWAGTGINPQTPGENEY